MNNTYYLTKFISYFVLPQEQKQKGRLDDVEVIRKMSKMVTLFSKENDITVKRDMAYETVAATAATREAAARVIQSQLKSKSNKRKMGQEKNKKQINNK
tara:strand:+ start:359 stop:655 length:297 start_codon:yes stop_codon:yes gene_type:complete